MSVDHALLSSSHPPEPHGASPHHAPGSLSAAVQHTACWRRGWCVLLLVVAGLMQAAAIAWPWGGQALGWLQILALALLVGVLRSAPCAVERFAGVPCTQTVPSTLNFTRQLRQLFWAGYWRGWLFATAWLAGTFWWLYVSMHTYGGLPGWLAALAVLLLAAALALYYALACGLFVCWCSRTGAGGQTLLFAALWLLAELCRGTLFTGFPWGAVGYAHVDSLLAGFAPVAGVYGIGWLAAWVSAVLAVWMHAGYVAITTGQKAYMHHTLAVVCVLVLLVGYGLAQMLRQSETPSEQPMLRVQLLQGNIPQDEKFQPGGGLHTALDWYSHMLHQTQADLVVTPETALPLLPARLPDGYWDALLQRFSRGTQAALIGLPAGNHTVGYANAAVALVPGGAVTVGAGTPPALDVPLQPQQGGEPATAAASTAAIYGYAKSHLVPFGEFVPPGFRWFVRMMHIPLGDFQRGARIQPRLQLGAERIQPHICYEDLFGEELAASFADAATAPTVLINMSNIAWFGDTVAIDQHRHISRMRALELARPVLRATNTGATAAIDSHGRVLHELPRLHRGELTLAVRGNTTITPYAWMAARTGLLPWWLAGLLIVALVLLMSGRKQA